jgi:hypothetical protein
VGGEYEGPYVNGKKQGEGIMHYSDGSKYVGNFYNDDRHGLGKIVKSDGSIVCDGLWEINKYSIHNKDYVHDHSNLSNDLAKIMKYLEGRK